MRACISKPGRLVSRLLATMIGLAFVVGTGCSESPQATTEVPGPTAKDAMTDLHDLLKELAEQKKPAPKSVADLQPYDPLHPVACAFIQNGSLVYSWGKTISPSAAGAGTTVIAREATAGANGSWVLLQDGTIKQMTADELKVGK